MREESPFVFVLRLICTFYESAYQGVTVEWVSAENAKNE